MMLQVIPGGAAPVTLSYSSEAGPVLFTVKAGKVFGALGASGSQYSLEPCLGIKNCHLWVQFTRT